MMITIAAGRVGGHFETEDDTRVYAKAGCVVCILYYIVYTEAVYKSYFGSHMLQLFLLAIF